MKKIIWFSIVVIVLIGLYFFLTSENEPVSVSADKAPPIGSSEYPKTASLEIANSKLNAPLPQSYLECKDFDKNFNLPKREWNEEMQQTASRYLEQGYSKVEIAFAIQHFRGRNFASSWVVEQFQNGSRLEKENKNIRQQTEYLLGEKIPEGMTIAQRFPRESLKKFKTMTLEERREVLKNESPTVDDIAAFMQSKELDESELLQLLEYVENPGEVVGSSIERYPPFLIEIAINHKYYEVVEKLLSKGILPAEDNYLTNALELAILNLFIDVGNKNKMVDERLLQIIKTFSEQGMTARISLVDNNEIEFETPDYSYKADFNALNNILQESKVDTLSMKREIDPEVNQKIELLIKKLTAQEYNYLSNTYGEFNYDAAVKYCATLKQEISTVWQQPSIFYTPQFGEIRKRHKDNSALIEAELSLEDPDMVDCFRDEEKQRRIGREQSTDVAKAFYKERNPYKLDWLLIINTQFDLKEANRTWIFYEFLDFEPQRIAIPIEAGMIPDHIDYDRIRWRAINSGNLEFLNSNGFNTKTIDQFGKSALYFAVKNQRVDLVKYMSKNSYPFSRDGLSQDPLHILLASWKQDFSESALLEMLPSIMQMEPDIDAFHLTRMKLMYLRDRKLYETIVSMFPQLAVTDQTPYPQSGCI